MSIALLFLPIIIGFLSQLVVPGNEIALWRVLGLYLPALELGTPAIEMLAQQVKIS